MAGGLAPSIAHYGYTTGGVFAITPSYPSWLGAIFNDKPVGQDVCEEVVRTDLTVDFRGHKDWRVRIYDLRLSSDVN